MTTPAPRGIGKGIVVAIAAGAFLAGCGAGCAIGVVTSSGHRDDDSSISAPTRTSPIPITPTRDAFGEAIRTVPVSDADAHAIAASACLAFKQNPGTSIVAAADQLAGQQGWTQSQARQFLRATTAYHCPEYSSGS
ncbi:DUF732 domain-containing protein [Mycolicibacterium peregrinum]|uniref:DUF732 domain-containing protein n=1 Tax=Mycolicibacterium peregrinum TaxID=43304 RepID=UPI003AAC73E5